MTIRIAKEELIRAVELLEIVGNDKVSDILDTDYSQFGKNMAGYMYTLVAQMLISDYLRRMKLYCAIRHPNWDMDRTRAFIRQITKNITEGYTRKKKQNDTS